VIEVSLVEELVYRPLQKILMVMLLSCKCSVLKALKQLQITFQEKTSLERVGLALFIRYCMVHPLYS